jgi:hypothetical protein
MPILALKAHIGQDFSEKPERRSLPDRVNQGINSAASVTFKWHINNHLAIITNSRQYSKNLGDKTAEKNLERKAKYSDCIVTQLENDLSNKKSQQSKVRKEFEKTGDKALFDQIATLDLEIRQIEAILTDKDSHIFGTTIKDQLGISHELQELLDSGFLDRLKNERNAPKNSCKLFNRPKKFTKLARQRILEGGAAMAIKYGNDIIMGTFTFPGRTEKIKQVSARYSRVIVNRLTQVIRDYAKYHGIEIDYIGSWEFHENDFLHLHLAFGFSCFVRHRRRLEELMRDAWFRILDDMGTTQPLNGDDGIISYPGVDMYERSDEAINTEGREGIAYIKSWKDHTDYLRYKGHTVRFEKCTKNPAGYVSKYISKQASNPENPDNAYCPKSWWCMSKGLLEMAKAGAIEFTIPIAGNDEREIIGYAQQFIQEWSDNGYINQWYWKPWDILNVVDKDSGQSKKVFRKRHEPRPPNSSRVSHGAVINGYIHPENSSEVIEGLVTIRDIFAGVRAMPPKDFNKFHANKYYADRQETNIDNEVKAIAARKYQKHKNYWERIAAGENYQDIYL